jgi:HK97 family phage prohead protease
MFDKKVTKHFEIRAAKDSKFTLEGRALSYNQVSTTELMPGYREALMPGCFRASLAKRDLVCLLNHDSKALPLGRQSNGTLDIDDDEEGLDFRCQLDSSNSFHRDTYAAVKRGDIAGCSFMFDCDDDDVADGEFEGKACKVRRVKSARIFEISAVSLPFYGGNQTSVSARSGATKEHNELLERALAMPGDWKRAERIAKVTGDILKG